MEPIIELKNLSVDFRTNSGTLRAVDNVTMDIYRGEIVGIIGESGSGKTTLISSILRTIRAPGRIAEGEVIYHCKDGTTVDLLKLSEKDYNSYRWTEITTVFQAAQNVLNPTLRIKDHFLETAMAHNSKLTKREILDKAKELCAKVRLEERVLDSYPHQLSGGMSQRVMIAMALACKPKLLIADEPTTALDVTIQAQILKLMNELKEQTGTSILFITHDLGVVANFADRIQVMYAGQVVERGTAREIFYDSKHPYTWALLSALPQLGIKGEELPSIEGTPPNLFNVIKGDAFAPRNKQALAIDFVKEPPFFSVSETHKAKTWYLDPRAPKIEQPHSIRRLREKMRERS